jgi:hypothetical protein
MENWIHVNTGTTSNGSIQERWNDARKMRSHSSRTPPIESGVDAGSYFIVVLRLVVADRIATLDLPEQPASR